GLLVLKKNRNFGRKWKIHLFLFGERFRYEFFRFFYEKYTLFFLTTY
ncbi:MAG: hypothetical protein ACI9LN_001863, partial [Saprospiraceae bacterium]